MQKLRININGKEVTGIAGQTILEVARENGVIDEDETEIVIGGDKNESK